MMKKNLLFLLTIVSAVTARDVNPEYQAMLNTRATILQLPEQTQNSLSLPVLVTEEESLNSQFADLLQQLRTLDTSH